MIRSTLGSLTLLLAATAAQAQPSYEAVYFKGNRGFLLSDSGNVYRSLDAGASWTGKKAKDSAYVTGIHFPSDKVGYMVGLGTILKTNDGGDTWTSPKKTGTWLSQVHFITEDTGVAVGIGVIMRTTDGGTTWSTEVPHHPMGGVQTYSDVWFTGRDAGYLVGLDGWIRKSADQGDTWDSLTSPTAHDLQAVHFPTPAVGYAVGDSGTIIKTSNAGASWAVQSSGTTKELHDVFFTDAQTGWAVGGGFTSAVILHTVNGGATWAPQANPGTIYLSSVYFLDANKGYAAGGFGNLLMTLDGGLHWGAITPSAIRGIEARAHGLRQEGGEVRYSLARPARVEMRLLDAGGRERAVLFSGVQPGGIHKLPLPATGPAAGTYLLEFRADGLRETLPLSRP